MIVGGIFAGAGFLAGLWFRVVAFVIFVLLAAAGYACIGILGGATISAVALDALVALVASQVGYFLAVLVRIVLRKRQRSSSASPADKPEPSTPR